MKPFRLAFAAATALALAACATLTPPAFEGAPIRISATSMPLDPRDPARDRVGDFVFAGAVDLTSPDTDRFHGLSDLKVVGDRLYSVNDDGGETFAARIVLDAAGRLTGLADARMGRLTGVDGKPIENKAETDTEGMALLPNGDRLYSFERDHRILRYPARGGPPERAPIPPITLPNNDGLEGLAPARQVARDAYYAGAEDDGQVWLCRVSVACRKVEGIPAPPSGYRLSALAQTPAGDLVLLHHWFERPNANSHVDISIVRSPLTNPQVIGRFRLDSPMAVDNFEGIDVVRRPNGLWRFYLVVDDNFFASQKTILAAFDWKPPR